MEKDGEKIWRGENPPELGLGNHGKLGTLFKSKSSCWSASRSVSFCDEGAMPVTGSSLVLRCAIVQDGVMRRSEEEAVV